MEPKAKTIIERHGFTDPDRKKPKHDEIQIWVYKNIDTVIKTIYPQVDLTDRSTKPTMEFPVMDNRFVIGFVDVYCKDLYLGIEIKTEIPVIGDLIRQIQFYRQYAGGGWIVVSPDDRFASILKDSNIHFFKYKQPEELF